MSTDCNGPYKNLFCSDSPFVSIDLCAVGVDTASLCDALKRAPSSLKELSFSYAQDGIITNDVIESLPSTLTKISFVYCWNIECDVLEAVFHSIEGLRSIVIDYSHDRMSNDQVQAIIKGLESRPVTWPRFDEVSILTYRFSEEMTVETSLRLLGNLLGRFAPRVVALNGLNLVEISEKDASKLERLVSLSSETDCDDNDIDNDNDSNERKTNDGFENRVIDSISVTGGSADGSFFVRFMCAAIRHRLPCQVDISAVSGDWKAENSGEVLVDITSELSRSCHEREFVDVVNPGNGIMPVKLGMGSLLVEDMSVIARVANKLPRGVEWNLRGTVLKGEGMEAVASKIADGTITAFEARECNIGESGAELVGKALVDPRCRLARFSARDNEIYNTGSAFFADALAKNESLERFEIIDNYIATDFAVKLVEGLNRNRSVRYFAIHDIYVEGNGIDYDIMREAIDESVKVKIDGQKTGKSRHFDEESKAIIV